MKGKKSTEQILQDFEEKVKQKVDEIIKQAIEENEKGIQTIDFSDFAEALDNELNITELVSDVLSSRDEVFQYVENRNEITLMLKPQYYNSDVNFDYERKLSDEDYTDLEIMCAKHVLWIYDADDGDRADFSNAMVTNINFNDKNLCGADLSNALFINCTFKNASLCDVDFSNSKFINCNFTDMVAEGSYQLNTKYINCDLTNAYFTASNFKNAEIRNSELEKTSFMNCCLDNIVVKGSNLNRANTVNVSYDEMEWNEDGAGQEMTMGGM